MALVLCKGKPYSPPVLHGYAFECMAADGEFPGPLTLWGAEVKEEDFHKFLLGVEGSPFFLKDESVVIPPPPPEPVVAAPVAVPPIPGAVPTADAEAAAALQRAAIASGALDVVPSLPPPPPPAADLAPEGGQEPPPPAGEGADQTDSEAPTDLRAAAFAPYAALRSKADIATLAKAELGLEMDPENSKMLDMLEVVKAELAVRIPAAPETPQS